MSYRSEDIANTTAVDIAGGCPYRSEDIANTATVDIARRYPTVARISLIP